MIQQRVMLFLVRRWGRQDPVADKSTYSELACWMSASRTLRESLNDFRMETRNICAGNHPAATRNPDPIPLPLLLASAETPIPRPAKP
ncbi:hypothetical protein BHM03_00057955 [Ensete ventricosum]|nr:hypothetical protein BHM03_00057955 [Ensete ventricosum]